MPVDVSRRTRSGARGRPPPLQLPPQSQSPSLAAPLRLVGGANSPRWRGPSAAVQAAVAFLQAHQLQLAIDDAIEAQQDYVLLQAQLQAADDAMQALADQHAADVFAASQELDAAAVEAAGMAWQAAQQHAPPAPPAAAVAPVDAGDDGDAPPLTPRACQLAAHAPNHLVPEPELVFPADDDVPDFAVGPASLDQAAMAAQGVRAGKLARRVLVGEGFSVPVRVTARGRCPRGNTVPEHGRSFASAFVAALLTAGVVAVAVVRPVLLMALKFVPKAGGAGVRLIVNGRAVSRCLPPPPRYHETGYKTLFANVLEFDWFAGLDLSHAFYHLPVAASLSRFLGFVWDGVYYVFRRMPMGISWTPYVLHKCLQPVLRMARGVGVVVTTYVDDFLVYGRTRRQCDADLGVVERLLARFGWTTNPAKRRAAAQSGMALGLWVDLRAKTVTLPAVFTARALLFIERLLALPAEDCWRVDVAIVLGHLVFASLLAPGALSFAAAIIRLVGPDGAWRSSRPLTTEARAELKWWSVFLRSGGGPQLRLRVAPDYEYTIYSDATLSTLAYAIVSSSRDCEPSVSAVGAWREPHERILAAESHAFVGALAAAVALPSVRHLVDSSALDGSLRKGRSADPDANMACRALFLHRLGGRSINHEWVPSEANLADVPTRPHRLNDLQADPALLAAVFAALGVGWPSVDLFARTAADARCERFVAEFSGLPVAAFPEDWLLYAFPPPPLLERLLRWLASARAWAVVVVPDWSAPWRPALDRLAVSAPVPLPVPGTCWRFVAVLVHGARARQAL